MTTEPRILFPSTTSMKKGWQKAYQASPQSTLPDGFSGTAVCLDFFSIFSRALHCWPAGWWLPSTPHQQPCYATYYMALLCFSRCTALNATCVVSDLKWSPNVPNIFLFYMPTVIYMLSISIEMIPARILVCTFCSWLLRNSPH